MTDRLDLLQRYRRILEGLLREHVPKAEVWAYGSRITGESHEGSDLDLVVRGPELKPLGGGFFELLDAIELSNIPILVQAHDWARLPESFHAEIERDYVVVQEGQSETEVGIAQQTTTLGDVADIIMGQSPPGDTVSTKHGVPLLNGPTEFGAHHPSAVQYAADARKLAQPGDLLFCVRGSTTGRMNWADQKYAIGRGVAAIRHRHEIALQPFVRGVIEVELPELLAQATGSTFPNVSASQLSEIPYPGLDMSEQRAIADILGTLDDKLELNRRMNETLEEMARTLFKSWFVDFLPVRAKQRARTQTGDPVRAKAALKTSPAEASDWTVEPARAYLDSMDKSIVTLFPDRLVDSELGEIPEGWEVKALGDVVDVLGGTTPSTKVLEYWNGGTHCWATPKDLSELSSPVLLDTERKITDAGLAKIGSGLLPKGSVLLSSRAPGKEG